MREDGERLLDIIEAIEKMEKYATQGWEVFRVDELIQNWMMRQIQIIGEAARSLSQEFRDAHPEFQWKDVIGMRHVLVHEYFGIDHDIVWRVVIEDIPNLKKHIQAMLEETADAG